MRSIIIDGQEFDLSKYSSLEDLVDSEFEGKDLSKIEVDNITGVPYSLVSDTPIQCTLEEALDDTKSFDTIWDWVDFIERYPLEEEATIAYIDNFWTWNSDSFKDSYYGYFSSQEDFAEDFLNNIGWDTDLSDFFDYEKYGEVLWDDYELNNYTQEALADYREELGLPSDYDGSDDLPLDFKSKKELESHYGFIGDDEEEDEEVLDDFEEDEALQEAKEEYDRFVEDHSWEIYLAEYDYSDVAEKYIDESWGGIGDFARENPRIMKEYIDLKSFADYLFSYDYSYIDGYVFNKY